MSKSNILTQGVKVRGWLKVVVNDIYKRKSYVAYSGPNLILDSGLTTFGQLLAQASIPATDNRITLVRFGDSSAVEAAGQTDVQGAVVATKSITSYTEDVGGTPGLVSFETTLDTAEGNGSVLREVVLMTAVETAVARRVIPDITKTNLLSVSITWNLDFSAA